MLLTTGNGCVGRVILFRECLKNNVLPPIITDNERLEYIDGIKACFESGGTERLRAVFEKCRVDYARIAGYFLAEECEFVTAKSNENANIIRTISSFEFRPR